MIADEPLRDLCRSLSGAVESGLPLTDAFATLARDRQHGKYLRGVAEMTASGVPIHTAFTAQGIFPPVFTSLMRAGEEGGKLPEFLDLYGGMLEVRIDFRRRLSRALILPAAAVALAFVLFLLITLKAAPLLLGPLQAAGVAVPAAESAAAFAAALAEHWPRVLAGVLLAVLALRFLSGTGPARRLFSLAGHTLPVFRYATQRARLYFSYTTMGLLLKAGFPLGGMMDVLMQLAEYDPPLKARFARAASALAGGRGFCESLSGFFPDDDARSLELAEKAGRLEETLLRLAGAHREVHSHRLKKLVTYALLLVTGAAALSVFLLITSVIKPVFSALSGAGAAGQEAAAPEAAAPPGQPDLASRLAALRRAAADQSGNVEVDTRTAAFNEYQGGAIARFISQYGVRPAKDTAVEGGGHAAAQAAAMAQEAAPLPPAPEVKASAPVTIPKMKPRTGPIQPTKIDPADVSGR